MVEFNIRIDLTVCSVCYCKPTSPSVLPPSITSGKETMVTDLILSADMLFSCYHLPAWSQRPTGEKRCARYIYRPSFHRELVLVLSQAYYDLWSYYTYIHGLYQADLEEVSGLYLDAKSSARLLQEQQERYIT
jgi:hypothetical protein